MRPRAEHQQPVELQDDAASSGTSGTRQQADAVAQDTAARVTAAADAAARLVVAADDHNADDEAMAAYYTITADEQGLLHAIDELPRTREAAYAWVQAWKSHQIETILRHGHGRGSAAAAASGPGPAPWQSGIPATSITDPALLSHIGPGPSLANPCHS